jgi:hypothetical protein
LTEPLPLPVVGPLKVIQDTGLDALHAHPAVVVIATFPVAALALHEALVGEMLNVQAPAWFSVNVWPPAAICPDRGVVVGFAVTE